MPNTFFKTLNFLLIFTIHTATTTTNNFNLKKKEKTINNTYKTDKNTGANEPTFSLSVCSS